MKKQTKNIACFLSGFSFVYHFNLIMFVRCSTRSKTIVSIIFLYFNVYEKLAYSQSNEKWIEKKAEKWKKKAKNWKKNAKN